MKILNYLYLSIFLSLHMQTFLCSDTNELTPVADSQLSLTSDKSDDQSDRSSVSSGSTEEEDQGQGIWNDVESRPESPRETKKTEELEQFKKDLSKILIRRHKQQMISAHDDKAVSTPLSAKGQSHTEISQLVKELVTCVEEQHNMFVQDHKKLPSNTPEKKEVQDITESWFGFSEEPENDVIATQPNMQSDILPQTNPSVLLTNEQPDIDVKHHEVPSYRSTFTEEDLYVQQAELYWQQQRVFIGKFLQEQYLYAYRILIPYFTKK